MKLILWVLICVLIAVLCRNKPAVTSLAVLTLWFTVPAAGSYLVTGESTGTLSLHAATWLIAAVVAVQLASGGKAMAVASAQQITSVVLLTLVVASAVLTTSSGSDGGTILLIDQIVAPVLFFIFVVGSARQDPNLVPRLRNGLLVLCAVTCAVGLAQWLSGEVLVYADGFATRFWFNPEGTRWMGTLDQPLTLSLAACVVAPLTVGLRRTWLQALLLALFGAGVLVSQSRVGLVAMAAVVLFVVAASRNRLWKRLGLLASLTGLTVWAMSSPLAEGLIERLQDDNGSAEARGSALQSFMGDWPEFLMTGHGINSSYRVAEEAGLGTSLENSFLMYCVDLGIFFTVLYFGVLLMFLLRNFGRSLPSGLAVAGLLVLVIPQTYSGLATRSAAGVLLWTILAMVVIAGVRAPAPTVTKTQSRLPASDNAAGVRRAPVQATTTTATPQRMPVLAGPAASGTP